MKSQNFVVVGEDTHHGHGCCATISSEARNLVFLPSLQKGIVIPSEARKLKCASCESFVVVGEDTHHGHGILQAPR